MFGTRDGAKDLKQNVVVVGSTKGANAARAELLPFVSQLKLPPATCSSRFSTTATKTRVSGIYLPLPIFVGVGHTINRYKRFPRLDLAISYVVKQIMEAGTARNSFKPNPLYTPTMTCGFGS